MNGHDPSPTPEERTAPPSRADTRGEQIERPPLADDTVPERFAAALGKLRALEEAAGGYGPAFLAYLELDLPEPPIGSELTDFLDRYIGYYPDRESFTRSRLDSLGWSQALAAFEAEQGMWSDDLVWDPGVLWEHLSETHGLVERFGGVHAFRI